MKVDKFTKDEIELIATLLSSAKTKHSKKGMMYNHLDRLEQRVNSLVGDNDTTVIYGQFIDVKIICQDVLSALSSKDCPCVKNTTEFIRDVWNKTTESETTAFERQS